MFSIVVGLSNCGTAALARRGNGSTRDNLFASPTFLPWFDSVCPGGNGDLSVLLRGNYHTIRVSKEALADAPLEELRRPNCQTKGLLRRRVYHLNHS